MLPLYTKVGGVVIPLAVLRETVPCDGIGTLIIDAEPTIIVNALTYDENLADTVPTGVGYESAISDNTPTVTIV